MCKVCGLYNLNMSKCKNCGGTIQSREWNRHKFCSNDCRSEFARLNPETKEMNRNIAVQRKLSRMAEIRAMGGICPGCLEDFGSCSDRALSMIFQKGHIHGRYCEQHEKGGFYWLCTECNLRQGEKCGKFERGVFKQICETP